MFAVVDIAGQQFKVTPDSKVFVHRLDAAEGETVSFEKVLLVTDNSSTQIGKPFVAGARVTARVMAHVKGDKVLVFHKKRRKGYQKLNGHRQQFTQLHIEAIEAK